MNRPSIYGAPGHWVTALRGNSGTSGSCYLKAPPISVFPSYYKYRQQKGKESMEKAPLFFTARPKNDTHHLCSPSFGENHPPRLHLSTKGSWEIESLAGQPLPSDDSSIVVTHRGRHLADPASGHVRHCQLISQMSGFTPRMSSPQHPITQAS